MTILTNLVVNKNIKSKREFCRQSVSLYFNLFDVFPNLPFTTMKRSAIITLRVAERLQSEDLRKLKKNQESV